MKLKLYEMQEKLNKAISHPRFEILRKLKKHDEVNKFLNIGILPIKSAVDRAIQGKIKHYVCSKSLVNSLLCTSIDCLGSAIKVPFSEMIIEIPEGIFVRGDDTSTIGFLVQKYDRCQSSIFKTYDEIKGREDCCYAVWSLGEIKVDHIVKQDPNSKFIGTLKLNATPHILVFDEDTEVKIHYKNYSTDHRLLPGAGDERRFLINLFLYLTSRDPDIIEVFDYKKIKVNKKLKGRSLKRNLEKQYAQKGKNPYSLVGSKLIFESKEPSQSSKSNSKIEKRFLVSGHWRWQWKGSENLDNRRQEHIWIKPFWKGKDFSEIVNSTRVVKNELEIVA